jgi:aminoglycoside 3-N-acetyltransferase
MHTKLDIINQLKNMGAPTDKPVIVHTSLRAIGEVEGGAQGLLNAFIEYFTKDGGLLCIPTHTWANFDNKKDIILDMLDNKTCIGVLPNVAVSDKRGVRTENPTHSLKVFGAREMVEKFIESDKMVLTPTSPNGCYGKIFDMDGCVLLVGVGHDKNTYLHCVEEMLNLPNRISDKAVDMKIKDSDGVIKNRKFCYMRTDVIYDVSVFFPKLEPAFRAHGGVKDGVIGNATAQLCSARIMKETMELITKNSGGIELMSDDKPLKIEWY